MMDEREAGFDRAVYLSREPVDDVPYMYAGPAPALTVAELQDNVASRDERDVQLVAETVDLNLTENVLRFATPDRDYVELEAASSIPALAQQAGTPAVFARKLLEDAPELLEHLLSGLMTRQASLFIGTISSRSLMACRQSGPTAINLMDALRVAERVFGASATVVGWRSDIMRLQLDVVTLPTAPFRITQQNARVGDVTLGGSRITCDRRPTQAHAPKVTPLLFRLVCLNGMQAEQIGETRPIDARGLTRDGVLERLEAEVRMAHAATNRLIEGLYELRFREVENPTQMLERLAREQGLAKRVLDQLLVLLPLFITGDGRATLFDLTNLLSHFANNPDFESSRTRLSLQRAGGAVIDSHVSRCPECQALLP